MAICPSCGEENPDRFRLCGFCGTPLHTVEPAREIRKTARSGGRRSSKACRSDGDGCALDLGVTE